MLCVGIRSVYAVQLLICMIKALVVYQPACSGFMVWSFPDLHELPTRARLIETSKLCNQMIILRESMGVQKLLNISFHLPIRGDPIKHLIGVFLMDNTINEHGDMRQAVLSFYNQVSPDELHGAVWHAIMRRFMPTNESDEYFWSISYDLCWHPALSVQFFAECFHGVGHGASLSSMPCDFQSEYLACPCPMLSFKSIRERSPFNMAVKRCVHSNTRFIQLWCADGVYHSQSMYFQNSSDPFDCRDTFSPYTCLNYNAAMVKILKANVEYVQAITGEEGLAFLDWFAYSISKSGRDTSAIKLCIGISANTTTSANSRSSQACVRGFLRAYLTKGYPSNCTLLLPKEPQLEWMVQEQCFHMKRTSELVDTVSAKEAIDLKLDMDLNPYAFRKGHEPVHS